jgi:hypothetical protein
MEALLWQYAFGRPVTEAMANGHADAGELFEAMLTRLEQERPSADPRASRRLPVTEFRGASAVLAHYVSGPPILARPVVFASRRWIGSLDGARMSLELPTRGADPRRMK